MTGSVASVSAGAVEPQPIPSSPEERRLVLGLMHCQHARLLIVASACKCAAMRLLRHAACGILDTRRLGRFVRWDGARPLRDAGCE